MARLEIRMFGRLVIEREGASTDPLAGAKLRELLCYLVLRRGQPQAREQLATMLWPEATPARSRKYLRQTLWQLQGALRVLGAAELLRVESDCVAFDNDGAAWIDVVEFERACGTAHAHADAPIDAAGAAALESAVALFRGPLLDGWYQDWCLYERDRQQQRYLDARDALAAYHEAHDNHVAALRHCHALLRDDPAHEGTHQRLMRIHYRRGNRSQSLRQYDRCVVALDEELGVPPSAATTALYEQIRSGGPLHRSPIRLPDEATLDEVLARLRDLASELAHAYDRVQRHIVEAEGARSDRAAATARDTIRRGAPPSHLHVAAPR